jgi:DNA-binding transcriptional ArsR family regulator
MSERPDVSTIAAAIGKPARARMLSALMDGRALTATELALEAGVMPSTASSHLAQLARARLVAVAAQGRHRYFRIADGDVATLLERLMGLAAAAPASSVRTGPSDPALRRARICYDHLAGERGVALFAGMRGHGFFAGGSGSNGAPLALSAEGARWLESIGVDVAALRSGRRPLVRACLDWSERRDHLAGAVGAALLARVFALGRARRDACGRAVSLSARGEAFVERLALPR